MPQHGPLFSDSPRFFIAVGTDLFDEFGMKIGSIENLHDPVHRIIRFFDERFFVRPQDPHDVHFSDGKSQKRIGTWRMEKADSSI